MSVAETLVERLRTKEAETLAAFDALCRSVADGEEPDEAEALDVLRAAGKTPADLDKEVSRLRRVAELLVVASEEGRAAMKKEHDEATEKWHAELLEIEDQERKLVERKRLGHSQYMGHFLNHQGAIEKLAAAQAELNKLTSPPSKEKPPPSEFMPVFPDENSGVQWGESDPLASEY